MIPHLLDNVVVVAPNPWQFDDNAVVRIEVLGDLMEPEEVLSVRVLPAHHLQRLACQTSTARPI